MEIGEKIRNYRKKAGLTQQQVADSLNVSYQAVSCWENDEYLPELSKIEALAKLFNIPISKIIENDYAARWELHDRMFSEDHMYTFVRSASQSKNLYQTAKVLPMVRDWHKGQVRKGPDAVPYLYHPLMITCHALALGLDEDDITATALLHDVIEDCHVSADDIPVNDNVKEAVMLLSFKVEGNETKESAKKRYYSNISNNRLATIVKILDRCNNISSMAIAFSKEKIVEYIDETEDYVMPLLDCMKNSYPECYDASFLLKYQMRSLLESMKRIL